MALGAVPPDPRCKRRHGRAEILSANKDLRLVKPQPLDDAQHILRGNVVE